MECHLCKTKYEKSTKVYRHYSETLVYQKCYCDLDLYHLYDDCEPVRQTISPAQAAMIAFDGF